MKKALIAALVMLLAIGFTFANATSEQKAQEVIHITLSDINNADSILGKGSLYIAELVKERTNGRIIIDTFLSGQLGNEEENVQNLRSGAVGITRINVANLQTRGINVPEYTLFGLPYLLRSKEHAESYFYSEKGEALIGRIAEATDGEIYGLTGYIISTPRHFFAKEEVHSMADMANMKVRCETTPMKIDMMTAFGMSGTPLSLNDMYSALQTGMIEGGEHNLTSIKSYAFYEQCPYILLTHNNYNANIYLISGKLVDTLSKEDLQIINDCVKIACEKETEDYPNDDIVIRAELEAKGVKFIEPSDIEVWEQAAQVLYKKYGAGYEAFIAEVLSFAK
ncbi:MAG: TRAP transporter substrate-binding protein DctP [Sphaerochaetaceae bacterium]|jgi:TRAP-type C4-dicarboxylate transport system substrate-binding protein|nr:TRAP transporter substrate-binding protein DctP [Sphaerochaetaceae bacterium]